jgi:predicted nucleic acid-binding protein
MMVAVAAGGTGRVLRVCLDLNIWYAAILADARGRSGSASQAFAAALRRGESPLGPLQLVVSWSMLTRLGSALRRKHELSPQTVEAALSAISLISRMGPDPAPPQLLLGGTGVIPLHDEEDGHVLDVAVAGRADLLVTTNFADFVTYRTDVRERDRIAIYSTTAHRVVIAHLFTAAEWLREGRIVIPDAA